MNKENRLAVRKSHYSVLISEVLLTRSSSFSVSLTCMRIPTDFLLTHKFWIRRQYADNFRKWNKPNCCKLAIWLILLVIRLGLEPRTPTLKVLCSTSWASESPWLLWVTQRCVSFSKAMQSYDFFLFHANLCGGFFKIFFAF